MVAPCLYPRRVAIPLQPVLRLPLGTGEPALFIAKISMDTVWDVVRKLLPEPT